MRYNMLLTNHNMKNNKLEKVETIKMPTIYGDFKLTTYETFYPDQEFMRYVLVMQTYDLPRIPLIRMHSSCILGETFRSTHCDCGEQLDAAFQIVYDHKGIIFYLDQEGRGHGIADKTRELKLQEQGYDTVEASEKLGLVPDMRKFEVVSDILQKMNIQSVKLLTNNPRKIQELESHGITVQKRIPLEIKPRPENENYLYTKKHKFGHMLDTYLTE